MRMHSRTSREGRITDEPVSTGSRHASSPRILLPVEEAPEPFVISLLHALAQEEGGDALVAKIVSVPEQTPLELTDQLLAPHHEKLHAAMRAVSESGPETPLEGVVRVGRNAVKNIASAADEHGVSTIVTSEIDRESSIIPVFGSDVDRLRANTSCRLVVATTTEHRTDVSSILVPIAGGPHSEKAVEVARALAKRHDAWIDLLHVVEPDSTPEQRNEAQQYVEAGSEQLDDFDNWDTWILEADSVTDAIIEQSAHYGVTVLGSPQSGRLRQFVFGSKTDNVRARADSAVVTVWAENTASSRVYR